MYTDKQSLPNGQVYPSQEVAWTSCYPCTVMHGDQSFLLHMGFAAAMNRRAT